MVTFSTEQDIPLDNTKDEVQTERENIDGAGRLEREEKEANNSDNSGGGTGMFSKLFGAVSSLDNTEGFKETFEDNNVHKDRTPTRNDQQSKVRPVKKGISFGDEIHHDNSCKSRPLTPKPPSSHIWVPSDTVKVLIDLLGADAKQLDKIQENVFEYANIDKETLQKSSTNIRSKRFSMHTSASSINQELRRSSRLNEDKIENEEDDFNLQMAMSPQGHKRMSIRFKMEKKKPPPEPEVLKDYVKVVDEVTSRWRRSTMMALDALKDLECTMETKQKQLASKKEAFIEKEEAVKSTKASNDILKKYLMQLELRVAALGSGLDLNTAGANNRAQQVNDKSQSSGYIQEGLYSNSWSTQKTKEEQAAKTVKYVDQVLSADNYVFQSLNQYKAIAECTSNLSTSHKSKENKNKKNNYYQDSSLSSSSTPRYSSPSIRDYIEDLQFSPPLSKHNHYSAATPRARSTPKSDSYSLYYHQPDGIKQPLNPNPHLVQFMDTETTRSVKSNQTLGSTIGSSSSGATYLSFTCPSTTASHLSTSKNPNHYTNTHTYNLFDPKDDPNSYYNTVPYFDRSNFSRPPTKLFRKPLSPTRMKDQNDKSNSPLSSTNFNTTTTTNNNNNKTKKKQFPYLKVKTSPKPYSAHNLDTSPRRPEALALLNGSSPRSMPNYKTTLSPKSVKSYSPRNAYTNTSASAHSRKRLGLGDGVEKKVDASVVSPRAMLMYKGAKSPRVYKFDAAGKAAKDIISAEVLSRIHAFTKVNNIVEKDFVKYMLLHGENIIIPEKLIETLEKMGVHLSTAEARTVCSILSIDKKSAAISLDRFVEAVYDPPPVPAKDYQSTSSRTITTPSTSTEMEPVPSSLSPSMTNTNTTATNTITVVNNRPLRISVSPKGPEKFNYFSSTPSTSTTQSPPTSPNAVSFPQSNPTPNKISLTIPSPVNLAINTSLGDEPKATKIVQVNENPALQGILNATTPKKLGAMASDVRRRLSREERERGFDNRLSSQPKAPDIFARESSLRLERLQYRQGPDIPSPPPEVESIFQTIASHCKVSKEDLNRIYRVQDIHKTGWVTYDEMGSTLCAFGTFVCASETKSVARWMLPLRNDNLIYLDDIMLLVDRNMDTNIKLYRNTVRSSGKLPKHKTINNKASDSVFSLGSFAKETQSSSLRRTKGEKK